MISIIPVWNILIALQQNTALATKREKQRVGDIFVLLRMSSDIF